MYRYGLILYKGDGVEANQKEGLVYLKKAADLGNAEARKFYLLVELLSKL